MQQRQHLFDVLLGNRNLQAIYYPWPAACEENVGGTEGVFGTC